MAYKDPIKKKEYAKAWREEHKEEYKEYMKAWRDSHKEEEKAKKKAWRETNKAYLNSYGKRYIAQDFNSFGQTKHYIRNKSRLYLKKYGQKIEGYQIHHCFTYNEPYKFIYCSRQMHRLIHEYLRAHNIDADSEHYQYIKHLLDYTVIKYNVD